jgi:hypothetical protein
MGAKNQAFAPAVDSGQTPDPETIRGVLQALPDSPTDLFILLAKAQMLGIRPLLQGGRAAPAPREFSTIPARSVEVPLGGGVQLDFSGGLLILSECRLKIDQSKSMRATEWSFALEYDKKMCPFEPGETENILRHKPVGWSANPFLAIRLVRKPFGSSWGSVTIERIELYGTFLKPQKH